MTRSPELRTDRHSVLKATIQLFVALLLIAPAASAQATHLVDPTDPAYRDLQQLIDEGLIDRLSIGQRPLSRAVFARALAEARQTLSSSEAAGAANPESRSDSYRSPERSGFLRELIASLRERLELPDSIAGGSALPSRIATIRSLSLELIRADEPARRIPENNGLGEIDGTLNTLLAFRQGRQDVEGNSALLESSHTLEMRHMAISATPQAILVGPANGKRRADFRLQELQIRFLVRNVALDVGREYVVWGQGRDVGLLNSNNSPPLDLIKLSSEHAFVLPWLFRRLGPTRLSLFYSDLGGDQNFPHAYAIAYRASINPASQLELGASVYTKSGGSGAPPATMTARFLDLLPFLDASAYNNAFGTRGDFQFSDHYAGFDGRLRLHSLGSSIYWEVLLNDFDVRRMKSVLWEDAGHVFGADLPPLSASGRLRASLEYHHTGLRYYEHQQFTSGQTVHHILTGDPLGPNAHGLYGNIDWTPSAICRMAIQAALERRSNDLYAYVPEPHFGFTRVDSRPKEWRARVVASWQLLPERRELGGLVQVGYERIRNFNFVNLDDQNGFLGRVSLQYRFE